jgi:hypothetical protein
MKLQDTEARCRPSGVCVFSDQCARALAPLPKKYASIMDGTRGATMISLCMSYIDVRVGDIVEKAERKVHPAPRGIA